MDEIDRKIEEILMDICKNGKFAFSKETNQYYQENQKYFSLMVSDDYKLLTRSFGRDFYLTEYGKKVCKRGGWLRHLEIEEKRDKRKEQKEIFDYAISAFHTKTKLLPYFVSFAGLIVAILTYITLSKQIREQTEKNPMPKTEIITIIDSVLTSDRYQSDSLSNSP